MSNQIQESINKAIDTIVNRRINTLSLDKTVIATIDSVVDSAEGIYRVQYEGGYFNARAQYNDAEAYPKNMAVYVQIPQNDMTKDKLIIGRAYNLRDSIEADVAISAINNYSIIGGNSFIINNKEQNDIGIALRSYHNPATETTSNNWIQHRARLIYDDAKQNTYLYSLNKDNLNLYLKNATALMVEADFKTTLDSEQQFSYDGSFGIGLNLVFNNSNYEFGKTQGEIFDYFAGQISATFESINSSGNLTSITRTLAQYNTDIKNAIQTSSSYTYNNLIKSDGVLDMYIAYINSLVDTYANTYQDKWIPKEAEIVEKYILLINSLKTQTSKANMVTAYNNWRNLVVGDDSEKVVSYVLDSNSMTGNPYAYTAWSTQYAIFDIDIKNFKRIENILFYKNGFKVDENMCQHGEDGNNDGVVGGSEDKPKEDIFIRNLKVYALQPLSAISDNYRLEIQAKETGLIFNTTNSTETLQVQAKVTKSYYEDLSNYTKFYWFKKDSTVNSAIHEKYNDYGGIGWAYLSKTNEKKITLVGNENYAYENKYKCVAVVDEETVLSDTFIVYNTSLMTNIKLESNLGTNFSFDTGIPIIKCLIKTKDADEYTENTTTTFYYYWAVQIDGKITFLDKLTPPIDPSSATAAEDLLKIQNLSNLVKDVNFYKGTSKITSESNLKTATRIQYPVKNIALATSATFICFVQQKIGSTYYDIGSAELPINNVNNPEINEFRIVLENGSQVFQYDEYGNAPNSKKLKSPLTIKPVICHLFNPTGLEVPNSNYEVEWIVPIENSLLTFTGTTLIPNPAENNISNINPKKQCVFGILDPYDEDYQDNTILCRVKYNNKVFEKNTSFYFGKSGSNGTNGTDVVLRILPTSTAALLNDQPLTLYRYNYNESTGKYANTKFNTGQTTKIITDILSIKLYQKGVDINSSGIVSTWNIAGNQQTTQNNKGKYLQLATDGKKITWNESFPSTSTDFNAAFDNYIIRGMAKYENKTYYGFYTLPIISYREALPNYTRIAINNKTLLKEVLYNADGRNPIYSHEQGIELLNVPSDCSVSWVVRGGSSNNTATNTSIKILPTKETSKSNAKTSHTTAVKANHRIWILPADDYSGGYCNNRVVATIKRGSTVIAEAIIPIHLTLNTFGLASLNAWDGNSITIDEEGGYIMAPQIGAGEKDSNNRFTGILMGKTETKTGKSTKAKEVGLFGYAHGLQSIFLDAETGEAYFGLPDGYRLDKSGTTPAPASADTTASYDEGRIELKPGDVSKIGGWHLGRGSLYYESINGTNSVKISNAYSDKWARNSSHLKDIGHTNRGILLNAVPLPYISIKGRQLTVYNTGNSGKPSDYDIDNTSGNAAIVNGDSLELNLDPNQKDFFTMFRHFKDGNTWTREPLVGIDAMGRFYTNSLKDKETNLSMNYVPGFGQNSINKAYVGLFVGYGTNALFKAFIPNGGSSSADLYISGGSVSNEYIRPLSFHGKTISLYAADSNANTANTAKQQDSKITISNSNFYAGNVGEGYISINRSGSGTSAIYTPDNFKLTSVTGKITTEAKNGSVEINALSSSSRNNNGADFTLSNTSDATLNSAGGVNLYARVWNSTNKTYTTPAFLTISNTGNSQLQSANNMLLYAKKNSNNIQPQLNIGSIDDTTLTSANNIYLYSHSGKTRAAEFSMTSSGSSDLKSAGSVNLYARTSTTNSDGTKSFTNTAYLTMSNTGNTFLRSAGSLFLYGYNNGSETAHLYMFNNDYTELKSAGSVNLYARTSTTNSDGTKSFTNTAYLTMSNTGETSLQSAGSVNIKTYDENKSKSSLIISKSQDTILTSARDIYLRTPKNETKNKYPAELIIREAGNSLFRSAADTSILAGSSIGIYAGAGIDDNSSANGIYLPVASVNQNAFFKVVRPLDISSIGNMNIKANSGNNGGKLSLESGLNTVINAGTNLDIDSGAGITVDAASGVIKITANGAPTTDGTNAFQVSTNHGDFSIQKNNSYKSNLLYSNDLGLKCKFGYFDGTISSSTAYSVQCTSGMYSGAEINTNTIKIRETINGGCAYNYKFGTTQKIKKGNYEISGGNIGALLEAILGNLNTLSNTVSSLSDSVSELDGSLTDLTNAYNTFVTIDYPDAMSDKVDVFTWNNYIPPKASSAIEGRVDWGTFNTHKHGPDSGYAYVMQTNGETFYVTIDGQRHRVQGIPIDTRTGTPS